MVAARANEVVAARLDGRVVRVIAKNGQRVHAGDPIAELDPTLLADRLRSATATADAARAAGGQRSTTKTDEGIKTYSDEVEAWIPPFYTVPLNIAAWWMPTEESSP